MDEKTKYLVEELTRKEMSRFMDSLEKFKKSCEELYDKAVTYKFPDKPDSVQLAQSCFNNEMDLFDKFIAKGEEIDKKIAENKKEIQKYIDHLEKFEIVVFKEIEGLKRNFEILKVNITPANLNSSERPRLKLKPIIKKSD